MTAHRIVHIDTLDHGLVTVHCPTWCTGDYHQAGGYRSDLSHSSEDVELTVPTSRGDVVLLRTCFEQRPFTEGPPGTGVFVNVEIDGDWYPSSPDDLDRLAAALVERATQLRATARELAVLAGGEQ